MASSLGFYSSICFYYTHILGSICLRSAAVVLECLDVRLGLGPFALAVAWPGRYPCEDLQGGVLPFFSTLARSWPVALQISHHFPSLLLVVHCGAHVEWGWLPIFRLEILVLLHCCQLSAHCRKSMLDASTSTALRN